MSYAELHCLTNFSFLRGASHPEELVERAVELGYAALAITDECSVAGVVRAHVAAREHSLPLIVGSEFRLEDGLQLVLLATSRERLWPALPADHAGAPGGIQGQLPSHARRPGAHDGCTLRGGASRARRLSRAVAARQDALRGGWPLARESIPRPAMDRGRAAHKRAGSTPTRLASGPGA